jgi:hypothetical protein
MFDWVKGITCIDAKADVEEDVESNTSQQAWSGEPYTPYQAIKSGEGVNGKIKAWLRGLAFPPPVTLGIFFGAACVALFGFRIFLGLFVIVSVIVPTLNAWLMAKIGSWLKKYIEEVDREYIGVDIHIGRIDLSICYARVVIHHLKIDNPQGYKSEHLLSAGSLTLDLDLLELLRTRGRHIVVEEFKLDEVEAIIEYKNVVWGTGESNIQAVQDFVCKPHEPPNHEEPAPPPETSPRSVSSTPRKDASNNNTLLSSAQGSQKGSPRLSDKDIAATVPEDEPVQAKKEEQPKKNKTRLHVDEGGVC